MSRGKESHDISKPRKTADLYENYHGFLTELQYSRSQSLEFGVKSWGISVFCGDNQWLELPSWGMAGS